MNIGGDNSPNLSDHSLDTDEVQVNLTSQSGLAYATSRQRLSDETDRAGASGYSAQ